MNETSEQGGCLGAAPAKVTRCKFLCEAVERRAVWGKPGEFVYAARFQAVYNNSPENEAFFAATPNGQLSISVYKSDLFVPGVEYFLDLSVASVPVPAA